MFIKTERLCIRPFKHEDWLAVLEYTSDQKTMHYIPEGVFDEAAVKAFVSKNCGEQANKYAVVLLDTEQLIGHISFEKYFCDHTFEIGWVFNQSYHSKEYATEAAYAVIKYGFEQMKLHRIMATCQPDNVASYRVMEKIGMRREGFFKKCIPHGTEWWDEYYYAILAEEWESKESIHEQQNC